MASTDTTRGVVRRRRSLVFYAWAVFAGQVLLGLALVAFVVVGSSYQQTAIQANDRVQRLQLTNLSMRSNFLDAERSLRGFQLTGQDRFLQSYYTDRVSFGEQLRVARSLAWQGILPGIAREADLAAATFRAGGRGLAAPRGSATARRQLGLAGQLSDQFVTVSNQVQGQLSRLRGQLTSQSQQSLGIGLLSVSIVLLVGLLIPVLLGARLVARTVVPLQSTTSVVRRLASGQHDARADPVGPVEIRELAASINFLADESDRLRAEQEERVRLAAVVRRAAVRVREHLEAEEVIREAATGLEEQLEAEFVWVGLISGGRLTLPPGNVEDWGLHKATVSSVPPDYLSWAEALYQQRSGYYVPRPALGAGGGAARAGPGDAAGPRRCLAAGRPLRRRAGGARRGRPGAHRSGAQVDAGGTGRRRVDRLRPGPGARPSRLYHQEKEIAAKLKEVDRAKSDFLAAVTHDLRTPLTSIVGYTEMLDEDQENPLSPAQRQMLGAIDRNAARLGNLIEDVLTMSRIEMGEFRTVLRPVDLAAVARETAGEMRDAAVAKGLSFDTAGPGTGLLISGSADQLDRALINLLGNAVKYTPHGGSITVTTGRQDGNAVVTVADTGIGIPEPDQPSLFTRFFRGSNVSTTSIPGTGLGLAIVKTIVDNHQGEIVLQSREGKGTSVTVRLPLLPGDQAAAPGQGSGQEGAA